MNKKYIFYFDETNNIRNFHLKKSSFNVPDPKCFVLGGIVYNGQQKPLNLDTLRSRLQLQNNVQEIKLKHLGKGDFLDFLRSKRVKEFLEWIENEDLFIHFHVIDPIYWAVVDIIDSMINTKEVQIESINVDTLKNTLHSLLRIDLGKTTDLLYRYDYPNVGIQGENFIEELILLLKTQFDLLINKDNYAFIKQISDLTTFLEENKTKPLIFLENEKPKILIEEFGVYYSYQLSLFQKIFPHATYIFDNEEKVKKYLKNIACSEEEFSYRFVDSKDEEGIQLSDIIVGILGKAFTYCTKNAIVDIKSDIINLSNEQAKSLVTLARIINRSVQITPYFAYRLFSSEDLHRSGFLLFDPVLIEELR